MSTQPPQAPPPGYWWDGQQWRPPLPQQAPGPHPADWWHDGHKWRPPVGAQPSRAALLAQVPGKLMALVVLGFLLYVLLAALGIVH